MGCKFHSFEMEMKPVIRYKALAVDRSVCLCYHHLHSHDTVLMPYSSDYVYIMSAFCPHSIVHSLSLILFLAPAACDNMYKSYPLCLGTV